MKHKLPFSIFHFSPPSLSIAATLLHRKSPMAPMHAYAAVCVLISMCSEVASFVVQSTSIHFGRAETTPLGRSFGQSQHRSPSPGDAWPTKRSTQMLAQGFGSKPAKAKKIKSRIPKASQPCPCFSGKPYGECCKPFHDGEKKPQPVEVMRARYAAFACAMPQFIMSSTHPDHEDYAKPKWREEILVFCNNYRFTGLDVGTLEEDPDNKEKAFVYFTAMMAGADCGGAVSFDERSIFLLNKDGEWLYRAPDEDYESSVNVVSKRKYNRVDRVDKPKGGDAR